MPEATTEIDCMLEAIGEIKVEYESKHQIPTEDQLDMEGFERMKAKVLACGINDFEVIKLNPALIRGISKYMMVVNTMADYNNFSDTCKQKFT